ncbi:DUF3558 domain-containing protein [Streptomyces sp. MS19]|uniref:DUF3558 domain-containing protein n=1 Tax=Streptomyces sp. MS19 TaxID=3385972 RepID=UPI0039A39DF2
MDRNAKRLAVRTAAWAAVPVLLAAGCSSDSSGSDDGAGSDGPTSAAPAPEPVRFAALPDVCATVGADLIGEYVPRADPEDGDTLTSSDTTSSATCLWSGLDDYQFRSLTVSLRRFDSDLSIGSGDERAAGYAEQVTEEVTGDDANQDVETGALDEAGDEAGWIGYSVTKTDEDDNEQDYRENRVVARVDNVVLTVDYSGAGLEGEDMPGADAIADGAVAVAREATARLDAWGEENAGGAPESDGSGAPDESGDSGESEENEPPGNAQDKPDDNG